MQFGNRQFNRRARRNFYTAAAVLSLALWLFMAAAEAYAPLHAWLHGGAIPDNDHCAIALIAHGKIDATVSVAPMIAPVLWTEIVPRISFSDLRTASQFLPPGRAPPIASVVS